MKRKELSNAYLSAFFMELSILLQAGVALSDGVLTLLDGESNRDEKIVIQSLIYSLYKSEPLYEALRVSGHFPDYAVKMVETGEKTNRMTETLMALSVHYDRQARLYSSIRNAALYPAILLVTMITVVMILIIRVLPAFHDVFTQLGSRPAPLAASLMRFGEWFGGVSAVIAVMVTVIFAVVLAAWKIPAIRIGITNAVKKAFGRCGILGSIAAFRFISAMSLAVASGLDIHEAVEMASAVSSGAKAVDEKHRKCAEMLRSGNTLAESISLSGILSSRNGRLLSLVCHSGMTDYAMAEIADRSERNVHEDISRMVGVLEPAFVIAASVIVGVILLSVMLPLMSIMASIG